MALKLTPHYRDILMEIRARRAVMVHRGGIADRQYCAETGNYAVLDQRLFVDDGYLDQAVAFVDELVVAMAARVYTGSPNRDSTRAVAIIPKIFV